MYRWLLALLPVVSTLAVAAERAPAIPDYPAEQVAEHTYVIHGPLEYPNPENKGFMNNPAFVLTADGVVVVDPGSSVQTGEMVLRQIRKVTDRPVIAVLNTHVHGDHWLGNQALREAYPEVPIYGHPKMIAAIEAGAGVEWEGRMMSATQGATAGTRAIGPNSTIKHGDVLNFGGMTFRVFHDGQSHSTSDVMFEVPQDSLLFLGDNANNKRIVRMDDGSFTGTVHTLDWIRQVNAEVLVPGHGRTGDWNFVTAYRDYMERLYQAAGEYYDQGLSDYEMKPMIAEMLADYKGWAGFEDELGKHISLAIIEYEAKAFQ